MNHPHQTAGESFLRVAGLVIAWVTSVSLADVQLWVAILSGLLICLYTGMKIVLLWKERFMGKPHKAPYTTTPARLE